MHLTAAAHFSIANPIIIYRRLLELKAVIYNFLDRHPKTLIIYRLSNYWYGDFRILQGVTNAYNGRRINQIIKHVFEKDGRVKLIDTWKMTEIVFEQITNIHPGDVARDMLADYVQRKTQDFWVELQSSLVQ